MDQPRPDPERLAESLADLAWYNRYLGGTATVVHQVRRLLEPKRPARVRVVDVGAGGGDVLRSLAVWCAERSIGFEGVGLDRGRLTLRIGAETTVASSESGEKIRFVGGDARHLPFGERAFEVAISSTVLHHLETGEAVDALLEMARVSRWGIVVTDLRRCLPGYLGAQLLARTVWRGHRYSRHDGPASVRAAFDLTEVRELAARAGLDAEVEPQPFFRWALRWERGPDDRA
ncbi:MAG: methyltransferase domain-containing protein [Gemmatimonadetes bacterium]|uniref:Methyltransferase domain-containing protein n=1 Tax=Candidatus Kutchimonas denitrificans TaxID=3056748 RepID=A0AAE4Z6W9_9BACT|nr:methyltransferase domain-containing protein [Gemmatimonadota bacterium]NIR74870.1 methyltransferase domain-containing protein [Candidatus Kutchimonas denitrificans]NIR99981.1 methyltransferase domain-containing protein [Gemmatimonadota bacterium]NIT65565.1 methyltransferase domain-containing protein [Gemmatimonadota bacterium]NIU52535.1 methyltransferase domain-containing protein [Gemmatimonadota bacterium]